MKLEIDIPEHQYNNIMAIDSVSLGRVPYKGIIMYAINAIKHGKALEQEPILDKIFNIVFPLSIMSTPELEHEAIMQIAEMLEPLCLPESEVEDGNDD